MATVMTTNIEQQAKSRVSASETLDTYRDIIFYDWSNWSDHIKWVATAPEADIVAWAQDIRHDQE